MSKEEAKELYTSIKEMLSSNDADSQTLACGIMTGLANDNAEIVAEPWYWHLFSYYVNTDNVENVDGVKDVIRIVLHCLKDENVKHKISTVMIYKDMSDDLLFF